MVVAVHLLKWRFQPAFRGPSWRRSIAEQRRRPDSILTRFPSLRSYPAEHLAHIYATARRKAADEAGLALSTLPSKCPFTVEEMLHPTFFPKADNE